MTRFTPSFLDELRGRLKASDVIGRHVKLKKEGREYRGLSPFTNEKTPSFFVNDEKGRFFDFSSGKSGDIIGFLMEHQKLPFPEAVSQLADMAGLALPEDSPEERAREEKAKGLAEAQAEAARFFRLMLGRAEGREAKAYLDRRGVGEKARTAFGLGYAPASRTALKDHLLNKDYPLALLVEAGLLIQPEDGGAPYDRFRDRLMFPILDARSRVIAFGGRALTKTAKAKYLNSPETPLFHKSHTLYNIALSQKIASKTGRPMLVAEGYMDVIALSEAGYPAVAPLGTALTENQLSLLWKRTEVPILCFDGDRAGRSAAHRAIDRALPLLSPGKSLKFVFLPDGLDPDDLVRQRGAAAMGGLIETAQPLAETLWDREEERHPRTTPEDAAAFRAHLRELVGTIRDRDVRRAYGRFIAERLGEDLGAPLPEPPSYHDDPGPPPMEEPAPAQRREPRVYHRGGRQRREAPALSPALRALAGRESTPATAETNREALLVMALIYHPGMFEAQEDAVLALTIEDPGLSGLLRIVIDSLTANPDLDRDGLTREILAVSAARPIFERWTKHPLVRLARFAKQDAPLEVAQAEWLNALAIDKFGGELEREVEEAADDAFKDEGGERRWRDRVAHRSRLVAENKADQDDEKPAPKARDNNA